MIQITNKINNKSIAKIMSVIQKQIHNRLNFKVLDVVFHDLQITHFIKNNTKIQIAKKL